MFDLGGGEIGAFFFLFFCFEWVISLEEEKGWGWGLFGQLRIAFLLNWTTMGNALYEWRQDVLLFFLFSFFLFFGRLSMGVHHTRCKGQGRGADCLFENIIISLTLCNANAALFISLYRSKTLLGRCILAVRKILYRYHHSSSSFFVVMIALCDIAATHLANRDGLQRNTDMFRVSRDPQLTTIC